MRVYVDCENVVVMMTFSCEEEGAAVFDGNALPSSGTSPPNPLGTRLGSVHESCMKQQIVAVEPSSRTILLVDCKEDHSRTY